jgi:hypothetical protein
VWYVRTYAGTHVCMHIRMNVLTHVRNVGCMCVSLCLRLRVRALGCVRGQAGVRVYVMYEMYVNLSVFLDGYCSPRLCRR